ncbi:hypothetical protein HBI88_122120 [Parastagonospora nodorum]|nr:hypothetical protein HBI09_060220 [Parastagonospora nodorum]KAH5008848.1 hypothetical protein HBI77_097910 [Parastagonospora nodorum]KAH5064149.1 hypothetical protein HBH96_051230 [Parastagonospora nodorum]KAH5606815.1 hypothetical protein HBI45_096580 [Parastagonospora nodorum]KAH5730663.1 hypothetical protein HBI20_048850 [Parastagonospora nodorum]
MSFTSPISIDDGEDEVVNLWDDQLELIDYDSDSSEPEITAVYTRETPPTTAASSYRKKTRPSLRLHNGPIVLPDSEIPKYGLGDGTVIVQGDTVELTNDKQLMPDTNQSGDFFRVKNIIVNHQTDDVRLRGYRLRRTKYLSQLFDWKLNELAMVLCVNETDTRSAFIAGMEEVSVDEIFRIRDCVLTNKPYPLLSFRDSGCWKFDFRKGLSIDEMKEQVFHEGRLVCRVVNILIVRNNKKGKAQSGIVRHLYAREADAVSTGAARGPGASRTDSIQVDDDEESDESVVVDPDSAGRRKRRGHFSSGSRKRHSPMPIKARQLTFGDVFCGAGGSSQGAKQAGLSIKWGLDFDDDAIEAYELNHTSALPFNCSAHDFPPEGYTSEQLRVDVVHLSPPCCFFSPAHTVNGPNDQANLEAIYTVGPILNKLKPRVATLEQTSGLSTHDQHRANFLMLFHDIGKAGYDLRWKNSDFSEYGLVQPRKRLLIIAARRGTPLPPFPKATHGPPGSGLEPWHFIKAALRPIERLANRPTNDFYHQPKPTRTRRKSYDPQSFLKGCITTNGGEGKYHYNGTRKYTPRELSLFQSFPIDYKFTGGQGNAIKQIGNAFPPVMAEKLYRTIAKTLEAFDQNHIDAEDDLSDLDELLDSKGVSLENAPSIPRLSFERRVRSTTPQSRYLVRDTPRPARAATSAPTRFAQARPARPQQSRRMLSGSFDNMSLLDGLLNSTQDSDSDVVETTEPLTPPRRRRRRRPAPLITNVSQDVIEVSSGSEDDYDSYSSDTVY